MESTATGTLTTALNASLSTIRELISLTIGKVTLISSPVVQNDVGVLAGIMGDL